MQKRGKYCVISLLHAMGRRQEDKDLSTGLIVHKAVGYWKGIGEREVGRME